LHLAPRQDVIEDDAARGVVAPMSNNLRTWHAVVAFIASIGLNVIVAVIALNPSPSAVTEKFVNAVWRPGDMLGRWLDLPLAHDAVQMLVGSLLFYFAIFWGLLAGVAVAKARFGNG
jgi:hypothetical protein